MYCVYCGSALPDAAAFCPGCGARSGDPSAVATGAVGAVVPTVRPAIPHSDTAEFGSRLGAWVLDGVFSNILGMVAGGVLAVIIAVAVAAGQGEPTSIAEENRQSDDLASATIAGFYLGYLPVWFGYDWISNATGAGWGKRILHLRVVDLNTGSRPGAGRGLVRSIISLLSSILYLGYLWSLWDSEHRTWHDRASATTVVQLD